MEKVADMTSKLTSTSSTVDKTGLRQDDFGPQRIGLILSNYETVSEDSYSDEIIFSIGIPQSAPGPNGLTSMNKQ